MSLLNYFKRAEKKLSEEIETSKAPFNMVETDKEEIVDQLKEFKGKQSIAFQGI